MIEALGLTRKFGRRAAVDGVSFVAPEGAAVGLLGPNGAGKTTTLRMLTGCLEPTAGTARVAGHDVVLAGDRARALLGYLPERPPLHDDMRTADYLDFAARLRGVPRRAREEAVESALGDCDLRDVRGRLLGHLSTGVRQRAGIAQALVHRPPVLILDEPTGGLDPGQMRSTRALLQRLRGRHTILLSTHLLSEVTAVCDRVVILAGGRVVADGSEPELRRRLLSARALTLRLRGDAEACADALRARPLVAGAGASGSTAVELTFAPDVGDEEVAAALLVAAGFGLLGAVERGGLEEAYLAAVGAGERA